MSFRKRENKNQLNYTKISLIFNSGQKSWVSAKNVLLNWIKFKS
jgi:hypothetical protein